MSKTKITVTVDQELVDYIRSTKRTTISSVMNEALRHEVERLAHRDALGELLAEWERIAGPIPPEALAEANAIMADL